MYVPWPCTWQGIKKEFVHIQLYCFNQATYMSILIQNSLVREKLHAFDVKNSTLSLSCIGVTIFSGTEKHTRGRAE